MSEKSKKNAGTDSEISVYAPGGNPETAFDTVNAFGTYNIQPTADTDNTYPAIAQGFNKKAVKTDRENKSAEKQNKGCGKRC